ncbi:MAG TPA: transglutaminaseTgpA domain-containing protein [Planctomycetaceae bacterium]|nr:transglutaminaseTgpA domain-containing protein [Planctomycetaceae bacterium]
MRTQQFIALALVLLQCATFGYLSQSIVFPVVLALAAVLRVMFPVRLRGNHERLASFGLLCFFTAKRFVAPYEPNGLNVFAMYSVAHALGQFCLSIQVLRLVPQLSAHAYAPSANSADNQNAWAPLPNVLPLYGVLVFICIGDLQTDYVQSLVYQLAAIAFVALSALYFGAGRDPHSSSGWQLKGRAILSAVTLVVALGGGWMASNLLQRYWYDLDRFFTQLGAGAGGASIGFSRKVSLGTTHLRKTQQSSSVALRVYSDAVPGYLRGASYNLYHGNQWESHVAGIPVYRSVQDTAQDPTADSNRWTLLIRGITAEQWKRLEIWPTSSTSTAFFLPMGTARLESPVDALSVDEHGVIEPQDIIAGAYVAYVPEGRTERLKGPDFARRLMHEMVTNDYYESMRQLPPAIDPRVRDLARKLFENCHTIPDKAAAVERYFHENYRYSPHVTIPPGEDPVTYFLLKRPPAHCEFFASGAAVLLRLGGVPCCYTTGFVTAERNPLGGYWLARNRDAHAWVEAYLGEQHWLRVEATPSEGIPGETDGLRPSHFWDDVQLHLQMLRATLAEGTFASGVKAMKLLASLLFRTALGWLLLLGLTVWILWRFRGQWRRAPRLPRNPAAEALRPLLWQMDRRLRRLRIERRPNETLHQFAVRLRTIEGNRPLLDAAAQWYLEYAAVRYRGVLEPAAVETLRIAMKREP